MNNQIKELAEQAGMTNTLGCFWQSGDYQLERFAELVRQDEREKCAKLCEELKWNASQFDCAAAIRGRTE
jgi:hypothetical protein